MIIEKYEVCLKRLTEDMIELVCDWRNSPHVSQFMEYRKFITPEMQKSWFDKINNEENYYFIVEYNGDKVGLINIKDVDREKKFGEGGVFIANEKYLNSDISFRMALCINDFAFETLSLSYLIAHILKDNLRAIKYNKLLGYKLQPGQEEIYNQLYRLTQEDYFRQRELIRKLF